MLKIRISYETDEELAAVVNKLRPMGFRLKKEPPKGKYKRAYLTGYSKPDKAPSD